MKILSTIGLLAFFSTVQANYYLVKNKTTDNQTMNVTLSLTYEQSGDETSMVRNARPSMKVASQDVGVYELDGKDIMLSAVAVAPATAVTSIVVTAGVLKIAGNCTIEIGGSAPAYSITINNVRYKQ